jgi:hypothetical protein
MNLKIFPFLLALIAFFSDAQGSAKKPLTPQLDISGYFELGGSFVDQSFWPNEPHLVVWNHEVNEITQAEFDFLIKPHKDISALFEIQFDRNRAAPRFDQSYLQYKLVKRSRLRLGHIKRVTGLESAQGASQQKTIHRSMPYRVVKSQFLLENDFQFSWLYSKPSRSGFSSELSAGTDANKTALLSSMIWLRHHDFLAGTHYSWRKSGSSPYRTRQTSRLFSLSAAYEPVHALNVEIEAQHGTWAEPALFNLAPRTDIWYSTQRLQLNLPLSISNVLEITPLIQSAWFMRDTQNPDQGYLESLAGCNFNIGDLNQFRFQIESGIQTAHNIANQSLARRSWHGALQFQTFF